MNGGPTAVVGDVCLSARQPSTHGRRDARHDSRTAAVLDGGEGSRDT